MIKAIQQEFFLPFKAYDTIFLKTRIAILTQKGFELLDLFEFKSSVVVISTTDRLLTYNGQPCSVTMPLFNNTHRDLKKLTKRCRSCRPMGLFRSGKEEFLLCYDSKNGPDYGQIFLNSRTHHVFYPEFGLYVNRHGQPHLTRGTVEWEGIAEHIAWHPPYVLIFNPCFIEVRHVNTGRLCQIIRGNDTKNLGWARRSVLNSESITRALPRCTLGRSPSTKDSCVRCHA